MTDRARRRKAEQTGRLAEYLAEIMLRLKGYRILARRAKTHLGELDLVALRGRMVVIVEVKQRRTEADARLAVSNASWNRIARAAEVWLAAQRGGLYHSDRRFDLFLVYGNFRFRHLKDTWRPDFALTRG